MARVYRVMVPAREYGPRTRLRWIVDDFRLGAFRTREAARRAARRAGVA